MLGAGFISNILISQDCKSSSFPHRRAMSRNLDSPPAVACPPGNLEVHALALTQVTISRVSHADESKLSLRVLSQGTCPSRYPIMMCARPTASPRNGQSDNYKPSAGL